MQALLHSVSPTLQPATHVSTRDSWTLMGKSGQSLVGSLLLYLGPWYAQGSVCALPESVSPALCKFWQLCGGLMATSSQRAYAIPRSTAPRAQPTADPHLPRGHPNTLCFCPYGVSVLVCTRYVWALWVSLTAMGFYLKHNFAPPTTLLGLLLCLWRWDVSSKLLQHCAATTPAQCSHHSSAMQE